MRRPNSSISTSLGIKPCNIRAAREPSKSLPGPSRPANGWRISGGRFHVPVRLGLNNVAGIFCTCLSIGSLVADLYRTAYIFSISAYRGGARVSFRLQVLQQRNVLG